LVWHVVVDFLDGPDGWGGIVIGIEAEGFGQLFFKMKDSLERGFLVAQPVQGSFQKLMKCGYGGVWLGHQFDEFYKISCRQDAEVTVLESMAIVYHGRFTQRVEVSTLGCDELDILRKRGPTAQLVDCLACAHL
jgi:hypothetical protein